jgi:hypothetical protein
MPVPACFDETHYFIAIARNCALAHGWFHGRIIAVPSRGIQSCLTNYGGAYGLD